MTQFWTIYTTATKAVIVPCFASPSTGSHPKDNGLAGWDAATMTATRIAQPPDPAVQLFDGAKWVEDPARVEAVLIDQVKAANAAMVASTYTTAFGKQKKYSRKQQEVMDFRGLAPVTTSLTSSLTATLSGLLPAFNALGAAAQKKKFRFAMAQAALRGVSIDVIINEFEAAIETIESKVAAWEAIELEGIRAIKAAPSAATKRAAYAAINWAWTPAT